MEKPPRADEELKKTPVHKEWMQYSVREYLSDQPMTRSAEFLVDSALLADAIEGRASVGSGWLGDGGSEDPGSAVASMD